MTNELVTRHVLSQFVNENTAGKAVVETFHPEDLIPIVAAPIIGIPLAIADANANAEATAKAQQEKPKDKPKEPEIK